MNTITFYMACFFALAGCLAAPAAHAAPFASPRGYSLTPPAGWRVNPIHPSDDVVIEYTRSADSAGTPNFRVDVTAMDGAVTLEALKPVVVADYTRKFPGLVVKSQTFSSLGGIRDLDLVFTETKNGVPLFLHQIYVLKNGSAYIFTAAYPFKTHVKYDAAVAQMLASVRWKGQKTPQ